MANRKRSSLSRAISTRNRVRLPPCSRAALVRGTSSTVRQRRDAFVEIYPYPKTAGHPGFVVANWHFCGANCNNGGHTIVRWDGDAGTIVLDGFDDRGFANAYPNQGSCSFARRSGATRTRDVATSTGCSAPGNGGAWTSFPMASPSPARAVGFAADTRMAGTRWSYALPRARPVPAAIADRRLTRAALRAHRHGRESGRRNMHCDGTGRRRRLRGPGATSLGGLWDEGDGFNLGINVALSGGSGPASPENQADGCHIGGSGIGGYIAHLVVSRGAVQIRAVRAAPVCLQSGA